MSDVEKFLKNPDTLEEAVRYVLDMEMEDTDSWKAMEEDTALAKTHHSIGRWIRNEFSLWDKEKAIHKNFNRRWNITHADDMSGIILRCVHRELNKLPWDVEGLVKRYKKHWEDQNAELAKS